jgi:hypothetical protein
MIATKAREAYAGAVWRSADQQIHSGAANRCGVLGQPGAASVTQDRPASLQRPHGFLHGRKLDPSVGPTGY